MSMLLVFLWKYKAPIIGFLVALGLVFSAHIWLKRHDAAILSGYVKQVELTAANAKAETEAKRADASSAALDVLRKKTDADAVAAQASSDQLENDIHDYETKLADAKRTCTIDSDDYKWLSKH